MTNTYFKFSVPYSTRYWEIDGFIYPVSSYESINLKSLYGLYGFFNLTPLLTFSLKLLNEMKKGGANIIFFPAQFLIKSWRKGGK